MSQNYGSRRSSGAGLTKTIRDQLNFHDEVRWKEFSNRRLELIDKFNLSSKKASEQDQGIKQIAAMLRDEFGFKEETLPEFDKLVRAAVQSVRRNRKRSSRARVNVNRFIMMDENLPPGHHIPGNSLLSTTSASLSNSSSSLGSSSGTMPNQSNLLSSDPGYLRHSHPLAKRQSHSSVSNLIDSVIPTAEIPSSSSSSSSSSLSASLTTSPKANTTQLPSLKSVLPNTTSPLQTQTHPVVPSSDTPKLSDSKFNPSLPQSYSKQKLLKSIQNSKTCLLLSDNSPEIHEQNLMTLGQSIITASISFVLERFFQDISHESMTYLSEKLNHPTSLSKILKSLGFESTEVLTLTDIQATNLFSKLIGCCVKDFGFDPNCYNLCEIFHEVILNEYPLVGTQITKISKESLFVPLLPMIPKDANKEFSKSVKLKFAGKNLEFKYHPLSNAPPTFLELIENGKTAFGIGSGNDNRSFRLKHNGVDVSRDSELEKLFRDLGIQNLDLELYEVGKGMVFTPLL